MTPTTNRQGNRSEALLAVLFNAYATANNKTYDTPAEVSDGWRAA